MRRAREAARSGGPQPPVPITPPSAFGWRAAAGRDRACAGERASMCCLRMSRRAPRLEATGEETSPSSYRLWQWRRGGHGRPDHPRPGDRTDRAAGADDGRWPHCLSDGSSDRGAPRGPGRSDTMIRARWSRAALAVPIAAAVLAVSVAGCGGGGGSASTASASADAQQFQDCLKQQGVKVPSGGARPGSPPSGQPPSGGPPGWSESAEDAEGVRGLPAVRAAGRPLRRVPEPTRTAVAQAAPGPCSRRL